MAALKFYINEQMAMDVDHERIRILRVGCGAFVLGADGKAKITRYAY